MLIRCQPRGEMIGLSLLPGRGYDEAVKQYQKTLEMEPTRGEALLGLGRFTSGRGCTKKPSTNTKKRSTRWGGRRQFWRNSATRTR